MTYRSPGLVALVAVPWRDRLLMARENQQDQTETDSTAKVCV